MRTVQLRAAHRGEDHRYFSATVKDDGSLVLSGHDLGPATAIVSPDGEYEYWFIVQAADIPQLLHRLGASDDQDILDVLEAEWRDDKAVALEDIVQAEIPHRFASYP